MDHREYWHILPEADTAILFIHGIAGTPNHFASFLPLVPGNCSMVNLLLQGHGGTVRDFSRASMHGWETQVQKAVAALSEQHSRILICAHSMGTLFAIEQAIRNPKIAGLFLLAVPLHICPRPAMAVNSAKVFFGRIAPHDKVAQAARDCYGIDRDRNLLHYLGWIPRYLELFRKIRETRAMLPTLTTPALAFQSAGDEMVSRKAFSDLKQNTALTVHLLKCSGHYYYDPEDQALLLQSFREFLTLHSAM